MPNPLRPGRDAEVLAVAAELEDLLGELQLTVAELTAILTSPPGGAEPAGKEAVPS